MEIDVALTPPMLVYLATAKGTAVGHLEGVLPPQKAFLAAQKADLRDQKGGLTAAVHTHLLAILPASSAQARASVRAFAPRRSSAGKVNNASFDELFSPFGRQTEHK